MTAPSIQRAGPLRIVVFTGNLAYSVRKGIDELDRTMPGIEWLILEHAPRKGAATLLRNQWRNLKRNGWRWIPYQLGDIAQRIGARFVREPAHHWQGRDFSRAALAARANVQLQVVADIHAESSLQRVRDFAPTLGLSLAAPILREALFAIPARGTLNLHKGKVPDYRGMPPAFWELWNEEREVGCTVHWVEAKLDTGAVVASTVVERAPFSTVRGLQLYLDEVGVELVCEAVAKVAAGEQAGKPQGAGGKTNRKPTLAQEAALQARLLRGQAPPTSMVKELVAALALRAWKLVLWRVCAPRVTVVLYHRVSDEARDNLTVGVEQFDRHMALLRKHCTVLSIEQVLAMRAVPRSRRPLVCVTFDDGYRDNHDNAAQIMLRHQVPGAFFVSTGLIGTSRVFPHDLRRGNDPIPMMNWYHLRQMRAMGFTIGSHTVSHIDCAAEAEDTVAEELAASRDTLRHELGIDEVLFAYPYGGRQHMTPLRLEMVRGHGYAGCLSAYGGVNTGTVDPFNVLRKGVHWEFSDRAFLFACTGLR
jgi:methionyl-tRNA formyltransferase